MVGQGEAEQRGASADRVAEIERRWLLSGPPPAGLGSPDPQPIEQGYLASSPTGEEVRLRRRGEGAGAKLTLSAKAGAGLIRDEVEVELSAAQFQALWPATEGRRLIKSRRLLDAGRGLRIELDEYAGSLSGLWIAEVEFPDEESARRFDVPAWFGREVTFDERFRNRRLAVEGAPPDPAAARPGRQEAIAAD
jgi:adenylate cyclase